MKAVCGVHVILWTCLIAAVTGCGVAPIYDQGRKASAAAVSARRTWTASGDLTDPQKAVDGNVNSAAVSGESYDNAAVTVDLGKACMFNMMVVDHGPKEYGFCRRVAVLTSLDGKKFEYRCSGPGTRRITVLLLREPVLARFVRLQAVVQGRRKWSVAEVYLH